MGVRSQESGVRMKDGSKKTEVRVKYRNTEEVEVKESE